jgi:hypothetical protein
MVYRHASCLGVFVVKFGGAQDEAWPIPPDQDWPTVPVVTASTCSPDCPACLPFTGRPVAAFDTSYGEDNGID